MEDDEETGPGAHGDWLSHAYTRQVAQTFAQRQGNLLIELMGVCERSADPCVAAAFARYKLNAEHIALFKPRKVTS